MDIHTERYLKNAKGRLESAEILLKAGRYNDAVSRVYYAFFDSATAALKTLNLTANSHHGLIVLFEKHFIKTGKISMNAGKWLARAKQAREMADYEAFKEFSEETVEATIKAANEFIAEIEKLCA